jgi:biopolymer transport protein ExbB
MNRFKTIPIKRGLLTTIGVLLLAGTAQAGTWWNSEWTVRKKITLDTTATGVAITDPIGTTPVLIRLHAGNFQFNTIREDGGDLRFVAEDDKTLLPYHIEKFDPLMGEAFVWVKVPEVKPGAKTSFWLYCGNRNPKLEYTGDVKGTYDSDFILVYHLNERGTPATDATGSGNLPQNAGIATDGSFIGSGVRLDEKTVLTIPPSASLRWLGADPLTIATWIKLATLPANEIIFSRRDGTANLVVGAENGALYVEIARDGKIQRSPPLSPITAGSWHHLAVVSSQATINLYLDGEPVAALQASLPAMNSALQIGGESFSGELDEFQISKIARPAGFIKLAAASQGDKGAKLLALGPAEEATNWLSGLSTGYVGVIVQSLTFDGWVVIGILLVMSFISWWVMIGKAVYLNGVAKGNTQFLKVWREVSSNLDIMLHTDLDHVNTLGGRIDKKGFRTIRRASLYHIYNIGAEELRDRLTKDQQQGSAKALSARSVQAIRATLDAGLIRQTQKLNSQIVLLTIAISGGPFLGLLGTVVGVMITFAAIAQQGEVNVNAIAPGISAALAATVAGLAVAIPALFGYNYLLSRIKDATSDMHVFIDEFVTKMAEFYGGESEEAALAEVLEEH